MARPDWKTKFVSPFDPPEPVTCPNCDGKMEASLNLHKTLVFLECQGECGWCWEAPLKQGVTVQKSVDYIIDWGGAADCITVRLRTDMSAVARGSGKHDARLGLELDANAVVIGVIVPKMTLDLWKTYPDRDQIPETLQAGVTAALTL